MLTMLRHFNGVFGEDFWKNVIIEVTYWPHDEISIKERNDQIPKSTEEKFRK